MNRRTKAKLIVLGVALGFAALTVEIAVRALSKRDDDGNVRFRDTRLKPFHIPVKRAETILEKYAKTTNTGLVFDPDLGWSQRPGVVDHNPAGFISVNPAPEKARPADKLRLAVFGGSYTQGTFEDGWWRVLERELNAAGIPAEVLNFGVGGYAMDQAYLRWKRDGSQYHPHAVIFGFAAANAYDNINIVRMVKDQDTGIPFTKPRFIIEPDGALRLLNAPVPTPEQMPAFFRAFPTSELRRHDWFWIEDDFTMKWWRASRFLALLEAKTSRSGTQLTAAEFYRMDREPAQLSLKIVERFRTEVEAAGSKFIAVNLPIHDDLDALRATGKFPYDALLAAVREKTTVVAPEKAMLEVIGNTAVKTHFDDGHYNNALQLAVGKYLAAWVRDHAAELRVGK